MYNKNKDIILVKNLMGHESIKTTDQYIKYDENNIEKLITPL